MKSKDFSRITIIAVILVVFSLILNACPPLEEDDQADGLEKKFDGWLNSVAWFELMDEIAIDGVNVTLNLSAARYDITNDNEYAGLIKVNGTGDILFDPLPDAAWGKDKIVSIILPRDAVGIYRATDDPAATEEEALKKSAFRHFTNLRSVKAENVIHIGNYAFAGSKSLQEVDFPKAEYIDDFAFADCAKLNFTKDAFKVAETIGEYAFRGCTSLENIEFPAVDTINKNAFEGCTSLTEAKFDTGGTPPPTITFDASVFSGCELLSTVEFYHAGTVEFGANVFEKTGNTLNFYLSDKTSGHPQTKHFLGTGNNVTVRTIKIFIPIDTPSSLSFFNSENTIAYSVDTVLYPASVNSSISVTIERVPWPTL